MGRIGQNGLSWPSQEVTGFPQGTLQNRWGPTPIGRTINGGGRND